MHRSRRYALFAGFAGLLCSQPVSAQDSAPASAPAGHSPTSQDARLLAKAELRAEVEEWNVGPIWQWETRKHQIKLTNVGPLPVKVKDLRSPCACTKGTLEKREFAPGESGTLEISFDAKLAKEKFPKKTVLIETDAAVHSQILIIVSAEVKQLFEFTETKPFILGRIEFDRPYSKEVFFSRNYESATPLELKVEPNPWFDLKLDELEKNKNYKITITAKPPMPTGQSSAKAMLLTGMAQLPEYKIPVDCYVLKEAQAIPEELSVPASFNQPFDRLLFLIYRKGLDLKIEKIEANFEGAQVVSTKPPRDLEMTDKYNVIDIAMRLPAPPDFPKDRAPHIRIITSNPKHREIIVPIVFVEARAASRPSPD